jgi:hypothetical protein
MTGQGDGVRCDNRTARARAAIVTALPAAALAALVELAVTYALALPAALMMYGVCVLAGGLVLTSAGLAGAARPAAHHGGPPDPPGSDPYPSTND